MSHSTQGTRKQIHNPAEKIRYGSVRQDFQSAADHFRIGSINLKDLRTEEICTASKGKGGNYGNNKAVDQNLIHTFEFMHTIVLTGKAHACLCDRVHRHIQKTENIIGRRIPCHGGRSKGINRGLKQSI